MFSQDRPSRQNREAGDFYLRRHLKLSSLACLLWFCWNRHPWTPHPNTHAILIFQWQSATQNNKVYLINPSDFSLCLYANFFPSAKRKKTKTNSASKFCFFHPKSFYQVDGNFRLTPKDNLINVECLLRTVYIFVLMTNGRQVKQAGDEGQVRSVKR